MMMTPAEIVAAGQTFAKEVGGRAHLSLSINFSHRNLLHAAIYPDGICNNVAVHVDADDWPELFDALREEWAEHSERFHREAVRKMALEIIRITAEQGSCTDAGLRGAQFTAAEVEQYGSEACQDADSIAGNGPFEITEIAGANAA